ncbi:MAG: Mrp/NBP35 family ATP-binding protein [Alphaproteobacteria bacterium]|nr:Mrp/NBP35 family ATP-binding protein [Alphaproteobacteria bacterium]
MVHVSEEQVLAALRMVREPKRGQDIVSLGMVTGLSIAGGRVSFALEVDPADGVALEPLRKSAEDVVRMVAGVESATAVMTAHRSRPAQSGPEAARAPQAKTGLDGVGTIVAVASGKGGVGKSTVAANLAVALVAHGLKVGLLDCDVYGPSLPLMMGVKDKPGRGSAGKLKPPESFGVKVISMGFLAADKQPMIWRGPMVASAVEQMLRGVEWAPLDVLVVDMPPGTGDAQLTLAQRVPLAGAVIVSTPQNVALLDARKGLNMFKQLDVPVLGIVENMSYFVCPSCGTRTDIFAHGGAKKEAADSGVPFLGDIPLDPRIRDTSDSGRPITASDPQSPHAQAFREIAGKLWRTLSAGPAKAPPRILMQ